MHRDGRREMEPHSMAGRKLQQQGSKTSNLASVGAIPRSLSWASASAFIRSTVQHIACMHELPLSAR